MNKKILIILLTSLFLVFIITILLITTETSEFNVKRIAHAGGGIENKIYTNSIDALNLNIKKGFSYFEIDLIYTSDDKLVCLHDWFSNVFEMNFGIKNNKSLSLNEFIKLVENNSKFNICTIDSLVLWMKNNPSAYIITDVKEYNLKVLKQILEILPNAKKRVIPQIYSPNEFGEVKEMGYKQIIWTLYNYEGSNEQVLKAIKNFSGNFAITMPVNRAKSGLALELFKQNIPTYVHTINSETEKNELIEKYGVTEIYTDFLSPE